MESNGVESKWYQCITSSVFNGTGVSPKKDFGGLLEEKFLQATHTTNSTMAVKEKVFATIY